MSIFSKLREERQQRQGSDTKPEDSEPKPAQELHQKVIQPAPIPKPVQETPKQEETIPKFPTQEVKEEIIELSDDEKKEFVSVLLDKYYKMNKEIGNVMQVLETQRINEKKLHEQRYRKELDIIDDAYNKKKKEVEDRYEPVLRRYKSLADKFKVEGMSYENKSAGEQIKRVYEPGPVPGPKIDEGVFSQEGSDGPELSRLLADIDKKYL